MVNDANLLQLDAKALAELLGETLHRWREGEDLSTSRLAASSLVYDCLLSGELPQRHVVILQVQALLRWAIDQLWPLAQPDQNDPRWKRFASLYYYYVQGMSFREASERMALEEQTVAHYWRPKALQEIAQIVLRELTHSEYKLQRKHYALSERYRYYQPTPLDSTDEQRLLRFCALLHHTLPQAKLKALAQQIGVADPQPCIDCLWLDGWLTQTGELLFTGLRDKDAVVYLHGRLTTQERQAWYDLLAEQAAKVGDHLEAVQYWCAGENFQRAAEWLIIHFQAMIEAGQIKELLLLQEELPEACLTRSTLARLRIAIGRAALTVEKVDKARSLLGNALNTPEDAIKAEACYYLGKTWEKVLVPQAHYYFDRGIHLLEGLAHEPTAEGERRQHATLLANLYIGKAWLDILHASDVALAEDILSRAELLIGEITQHHQSELNLALVNLHNALAGCYARQDNMEGELRHYHHAVIAAREVGDKERLWRTVQNLAQSYIHVRDYEPGLIFLSEAEQVAQEIGSQEGIGKCVQTRGAYHFFQAEDCRRAGTDAQAQLSTAIDCYTRSIEIFQELGDDHWLAAAHADLAEAYVGLPDLSHARWHYLEALDCARRAGIEDVIRQLLLTLEENHPELALRNLAVRELFTIQLTKERGSITSGELMRLAEISESTSERTLRKLRKLGLLKSVGKGRSTKYIPPNEGIKPNRVKSVSPAQ